jgi:hypothetical protein
MNDTYVITGLSEILNKENIKPDIDVGDIERKMLSNGFPQIKDSGVSSTERFDSEINEIVGKLGISFNDDESSESDETPSFNTSSNPSNLGSDKSRYDQYHLDFSDSGGAEEEFEERTKEEQKRNHIKNVIGVSHNGGIDDFSLEKEREEDEKCGMLAEIDYLLDSLKDEGVDISRIPRVDDNNDSKSIEKVLKVLRHKVDHARYCTFAEEFMLSGAHGLEYLFNGENMWFGRWKPDLTGWHVHVNRKLRRMRTDTGKIVSHVMNDYDIGPFMRVCLELIPSMILFSKKRGEQNSLNTYNLDRDLSESMDKLKDI